MTHPLVRKLQLRDKFSSPDGQKCTKCNRNDAQATHFLSLGEDFSPGSRCASTSLYRTLLPRTRLVCHSFSLEAVEKYRHKKQINKVGRKHVLSATQRRTNAVTLREIRRVTNNEPVRSGVFTK